VAPFEGRKRAAYEDATQLKDLNDPAIVDGIKMRIETTAINSNLHS
jgi:hypothetical protein